MLYSRFGIIATREDGIWIAGERNSLRVNIATKACAKNAIRCRLGTGGLGGVTCDMGDP
jgi:hypothetical protein